MFDYHVHTEFSGDCSVDMASIVERAVKDGLDEICFTDHLDIDSTEGSDDFVFSSEAYEKRILSLREIYGKDISIKMGVEVGIQPHVLKETSEFVKSASFDFALASMHGCKGLDFYIGDYFKKYTTEEAIQHYYEEFASMLETFKDYAVLGHLDIYKRYHPESMKVPFNKYNHLVERVLKQVIKDGKGIEINTSGLRGNIKEALPSWEIVELYKELGGEIITLGSDSHGADCLCANFEEVLRGLKERKFRNIYRFEKFKPVKVPINSLL